MEYFISGTLLLAVLVICLRWPRAGVWVGLVLGVLPLVVSALQDEQSRNIGGSLIMAAFCFALPMMAVLASPPWPDGYDAHRSIARTVVWLFGAVLMVVPLASFFTDGGVALTVPLGLLSLPNVLLLIFIVFVGVRMRRTLREDVAMTLDSIVRQRLPLAPALLQEAAGSDGLRGAVFGHLAGELMTGRTLVESLPKSCPCFAGRDLALIVAGAEAGDTAEALATVRRGILRRAKRDTFRRPVQPLYVAMIVAFTMSVVSGLMIFILPQFEKIMADVDGKLAAVTRAMVGVVRWFGMTASYLPYIPLIVAVLWIYTSLRPRRPDRPRLLSRWRDTLVWRLPGLRWLDRTAGTAQVAAALRMALSAGRTIDAAIALSAELDVNLVMRRRLRQWHAAVVAGHDIAAAARQAELGHSLAWAFDTNVTGANTLAALAAIEATAAAQHDHATLVSQQVTGPLAILTVGVGVGFVALAIIMPIAQTQQAVLDSCMP